MKTQSKLLAAVFTTAALLFTINVKAQTTPANALRFNIGLEAADPTGTARIGTTFILGGTMRLQYGVSNDFAITVTGGAYHFFPKYIPGTNVRYNSYGVIPLKAGIKDFFSTHVYFGAEVGVGMETLDNEFWGPRRLLLSPALGYGSKHWDVGVHWDRFSSTGDIYGLVGLRIAYGIGQ